MVTRVLLVVTVYIEICPCLSLLLLALTAYSYSSYLSFILCLKHLISACTAIASLQASLQASLH